MIFLTYTRSSNYLQTVILISVMKRISNTLLLWISLWGLNRVDLLDMCISHIIKNNLVAVPGASTPCRSTLS